MKRLILAAVLLLAACANSSPKSDVAALEAGLTAAFSAARVYATQPSCSVKPQPKLCSDDAIVIQIGRASTVAYVAVKQAEGVVKLSSSSAADIDKAVSAAQSAIAALNQLIPVIKGT